MQCVECGCTDQAACSGGCFWVAPFLCSNCTPYETEARCGDCGKEFDVEIREANEIAVDLGKGKEETYEHPGQIHCPSCGSHSITYPELEPVAEKSDFSEDIRNDMIESGWQCKECPTEPVFRDSMREAAEKHMVEAHGKHPEELREVGVVVTDKKTKVQLECGHDKYVTPKVAERRSDFRCIECGELVDKKVADKSDRKTPMIFSSNRAFEQLRDEGTVASFRSEEKDTGEVWIRRTRTGQKEFDAEIVSVEYVSPARIADMRPHAKISGFDSVEDWLDKIRELHGDLSPGYVHIVEKKGENQ